MVFGYIASRRRPSPFASSDRGRFERKWNSRLCSCYCCWLLWTSCCWCVCGNIMVAIRSWCLFTRAVVIFSLICDWQIESLKLYSLYRQVVMYVVHFLDIYCPFWRFHQWYNVSRRQTCWCDIVSRLQVHDFPFLFAEWISIFVLTKHFCSDPSNVVSEFNILTGYLDWDWINAAYLIEIWGCKIGQPFG